MKSIRWFISIVITILYFLGACRKVGPATPETTPIPATNTPVVPTVTSSPTMVIPTLTPTPALISLEIPECVPDGSGGNLQFYEALQATSGRMAEWDSYQFNTLYEYLLDGNYSPEDLSVQVHGQYSSLRTETDEDLLHYPMSSQRYINSHVVYTDLQSKLRSETIITPDGFWYQPQGEAGWIAFEGATSAEMLQLGEWFSPEVIVYMLSNGYFEPGIQAEMTANEKPETINGKEVIHRCWVIPGQNEQFNAYLNQGEFIFSMLNNTVVHLWTSNNDTELVRLALTGLHTGEYYHEVGFFAHESPSQFLLWLDIDEIDQSHAIEQPSEDTIVTSLPISSDLKKEISQFPFNDLPLPEDASPDSTGISPAASWIPFGNSAVLPHEYSVDLYNLESELMSRFLGPTWDQTTSDRSPQYSTHASLTKLSDFYFEEMSRRGWTLAGKFLEAGLPRLFLFFQREQVSFLIVLTPLYDSSTNIQAFLPPTDEVLEVVLNNWQFFDQTDNQMLSEGVTAVAFDSQGKTWIGTGNGIVTYDGTDWIEIPADEIGLEISSWSGITTIAVDLMNTIWVGSSSGIARYDGEEWIPFTEDSQGNSIGWVKTISITPSGEVWAGLDDGRIGIFDGLHWKTITRDNGGPGTSHDINTIIVDRDGNYWVGTDGGGVFVRENNEWRTVVKDQVSPDTFSMDAQILGMAFDQYEWLWIATGGSLRVFDGKVWYDYNKRSGNMPFSDIDQGVLDQYDRVWVASYHYGLTLLEGGDIWTIYSPLNPPEEAALINTMVIDPSGRIWIGSDSGLAIFTTPAADSIMERLSLPTPTPPPPVEPLPTPEPGWTSYAIEGTPFGYRVNSIAVDQQNHIWIAGWGVTEVKDSGEWTQYTFTNTPDPGLGSNSVYDIAVDKLGRIWMATSDGLSVLDEALGWNNYIPETSDLPYRSVEDVEIDSEGRVWALTHDNSANNALSLIVNDRPWITYTAETLTNPDDQPLSFSVTAIEADHQGRIWIASFHALSVLSSDGSLKTLTNAELGLSEDWDARVTALFEDDQEKMWIGTSIDGVIVLSNDGTTVRYSLSAMDIYGGEISAIIIDDIGRVWVGSDVGLSVLNNDGTWTTYTPDNSSLPSVEITSLAIDDLGRVWIGTGAGLAAYVPPSP
jgi:ligand-binding sensor domain-containing protein